MELRTQQPTRTVEQVCRRAVGRIGLALALAFCLSQGVALGLSLWLEGFAAASLENDWVSLGISVLPIYLLGLPLVFLLTRRLPAAYPTELHRVGVGGTAAFGAAVYALSYGAQLLTLGAMGLLSSLTGREYSNALEQMMTQTTPAVFLIVGLLAPLMEEVLFRFILLRRLLPYGRTFGVVASALLFSLFHGNFYQFGYAFAVGLALGYITVRTGSILHAAVMHICFNTYSNVMSLALERCPEAAGGLALVPLALAVAGVVVLVAKRKTIAYHLRLAPAAPGRTLFQLVKSPGMWLCFGVCVGMAVYLLFVL